MSFRSSDLLRLVKDFGETLTLKKTRTSGTYDPATGTLSGETTQNFSVTGYLYNNQLVPIDQVTKQTRQCVISALGLSVEPTDEDSIIRNGQEMSILRVTAIYSASLVVCYICYLED